VLWILTLVGRGPRSRPRPCRPCELARPLRHSPASGSASPACSACGTYPRPVRYGRSWGFPTYGKGPFESAGITVSVPLLGAFVVVCATEVVTAGLLWRGSRAGTRLALWLLPAELVFWTGFALPFGPPLALARTITIIYANRQRKTP
jgi:hypothetical protein